MHVQQVEVVVPNPIHVYVSFLKGTNAVNTKKKIKLDKTTKVAVFNEKISLITALTKDKSIPDHHYQTKQVFVKLVAFYNNKDKAIGIANIDLASYINPNKDKLHS